jgi:RHS repeat-associated protein
MSNNIVKGSNDTGTGEYFIIRNDSTTAGLVASIEKPEVKQKFQWVYQPLSTDPSERSDFPLYTVPDRLTADSYVDEDALAGEHFYFNSSMYVVAEMRQTNNYGSQALNEYAYEEAVYNNQGRGFQGFRKISVRSNPAIGSTYETTSESTFHQVFPLAGKLESVKVMANNGVLINEEIYCYDGQTYNADTNSCNTPTGIYDTDGSIVFHPLNFKHSKNYELNNELINNKKLASDTITSISYDDYGNIFNQINTINTYQADINSPLPLGSLIRSETIDTFNTYDTAGETNWWIDKLLKTRVTKSSPGNGGNHITYSEFYWQENNQRILDCQFSYIGADAITGCDSVIDSVDISKTTFTYDTQDSNQNNNYGNIIEVTSQALDRGDISTRTVKTHYQASGYFPENITKVNPTGINQVTSFSYDLKTGQVTQTVQADGNYVTTNYDPFGFKRQGQFFDSTATSLSPTAYTSLRNCNGACTSQQTIVHKIKLIADAELTLIAGEPILEYYTEQRQNGQPQVITWYDNANNPILTQTFHSDNTGTDKYNYVVNITSPLGVGIISTEPFVNTADAFPSISMVDIQGRITDKVTLIGNLANNSTGDCQLQTLYDHQGGLTEITASYSGIDCPESSVGTLAMSRFYDATGKLLSTKDALNKTVTYKYDASGNPSRLIDINNNTIFTTFDALGRKSRVVDPNMGIKDFSYNGFGEVIQQTAGGENYSTYYQYDSFGRITHQYSNVDVDLSPNSNTRSYHDHYIYDDAIGGLLVNVTRQSNKFTTTGGCNNCFSTVFNKSLSYDNQRRLIAETTNLPAALTVNSTLPGASDLVEYTTQFFYDSRYNRLKQVIYDGRYSIANIYTRHGALESQYDMLALHNVMQVTDWNYKGQETRRIFNNNPDFSSETEYYPSTGQVAEIRNYSGTGTEHETLSYEYDPWGNIQQQKLDRNNNTGTDLATEIFSYDKLHRLKTAAVNGLVKTYDYDSLGNITQKSDFSLGYTYGITGTNNTTCSSTSAGPNAVASALLIDSRGTISYDYDAKGNRVKDCIAGTEQASYIYDYNNLLVESTSNITGNNQTLEFNYGADNQRYRKYDYANNEITLYANKDYEEIYKAGSTIPTQRKYYITSYLTITKDVTGTRRNFMQKDRLDSTTQILDESGTVLHTKSYDAFGKPRNGDWSDMAGGLFQAKLDFSDTNGTIDLTKRGFTDHEHLDEMQLIHMNGRMYDYNNARFLSVDPFIQAPTSTQSLNPYTYIFNNPLSGVDPTGYAAQGDSFIRKTKFAPTGSQIKSGTTLSGVSTGGTSFSISTNGRGQVLSSNGLDKLGTKGASTQSGKSGDVSGTGNQSTVFKRGGNTSSGTVSGNVNTTQNNGKSKFENKGFISRFSQFAFTSDFGITELNDLAEMIDLLDANNEPILDEINSLAKKEGVDINFTTMNLRTNPPTRQNSMAVMILADGRLVVSLNTRSGLLLKDGVQSPVVGLLHEGNHVKTILKNFITIKNLLLNGKIRKIRKFKRKDDKQIIKGPETSFSKKLNQPVRKKHSSGKPVQVKCATCTDQL